jgi:hypothetical protein
MPDMALCGFIAWIETNWLAFGQRPPLLFDRIDK